MNHYNIRTFLGLILFLFILYNRLFRTKEEKFFYIVFDFSVFICYIMIFLTMIFFSIKNSIIFYKWVMNKAKTKNDSIIFSYVKTVLLYMTKPFMYIFNNLELFDIYIKNKTPYYDDEKRYTDIIVHTIGFYLEKYSKLSITIGLLVSISCQSILLGGFLVDIFIMKKFYYFYKLCWILIIPMIMQYIIYSVRIYIEPNLVELNRNIYVYILEENNSFLTRNSTGLPRITLEQYALLEKADMLTDHYMFTLSPELMQEKNIDVISTINRYMPIIKTFCKIHFYLIDWEQKKHEYLSLFNTIKYLAYSCCWFYLLYVLCM